MNHPLHSLPLRVTCAALLALFFIAGAHAQGKLKVLIVDGQNNHQWATTTPLLKQILEDTGRFTVEVSTTPPSAPAAPRMAKEATPRKNRPHRKSHETRRCGRCVQVCRSRAVGQMAPKFFRLRCRPFQLQRGKLARRGADRVCCLCENGGGFVSYHAANNSFPSGPNITP